MLHPAALTGNDIAAADEGDRGADTDADHELTKAPEPVLVFVADDADRRRR